MENLAQKLDDASRYLSSRQPDDAVKACDQILEEIPGQLEASHIQAFALLMKSQSSAGQAIEVLKKSLDVNPDNLLILTALGEAYLAIGRLIDAKKILERALSIESEYYYALFAMGRLLVESERNAEAEIILRKALSQPGIEHLSTYVTLASAIMPGDGYQSLLEKFHDWLQPTVYLEIGVETGKTLKLAQPPTVAIGVDPEPKIQFPLPETTQVLSLGSDSFFEQYHLPNVTGHSSIDFAFIDGLHVFDQVLRDFMNVERYSRPNTVVVIHDCLPLDTISSNPNRTTNFWSGDPWKVMAALRHFRPDLACFTIPTSPTGLGVITNLSPANTVLKERYSEIVETYQDRDYGWLVENGLSESLGVLVNDWDEIVARIGEAHAKRYE